MYQTYKWAHVPETIRIHRSMRSVWPKHRSCLYSARIAITLLQFLYTYILITNTYKYLSTLFDIDHVRVSRVGLAFPFLPTLTGSRRSMEITGLSYHLEMCRAQLVLALLPLFRRYTFHCWHSCLNIRKLSKWFVMILKFVQFFNTIVSKHAVFTA